MFLFCNWKYKKIEILVKINKNWLKYLKYKKLLCCFLQNVFTNVFTNVLLLLLRMLWLLCFLWLVHRFVRLWVRLRLQLPCKILVLQYWCLFPLHQNSHPSLCSINLDSFHFVLYRTTLGGRLFLLLVFRRCFEEYW